MSAELLRRAAKALRETAEAADPGKWRHDADMAWPVGDQTHECVWTRSGDGHDIVALTGVKGEHPRTPATADYIALMHPPVALALAEWLETEARHVEHHHRAWSAPDSAVPDPDAHVEAMYVRALTVARAILREEPS